MSTTKTTQNSFDFDEKAYLQMYPDIAAGIERGVITSAYDHYMRHGKREGRLFFRRATELSNLTVDAAAMETTVQAAEAPPRSVDAVFMSSGGNIFVVGWMDDRTVKLDELRVEGTGWALTVKSEALGRLRRDDAQNSLGAATPHPFGFWLLACMDQALTTGGPLRVTFVFGPGNEWVTEQVPRILEDQDLRDTVLGFIAGAQYIGNPQMAAMAALEPFLGQQVINLNSVVTRQIVASSYIERFAGRDRAYKGSIVVCLYGKPEFLFLQSALFAGKPGIEDYEWIFVSNSPELSEQLLKEARINRAIYGMDQTLVLLPANAGFGAANNAGVKACRSDRILIVNPDVFPKQLDWAARHTALIETASDRTRLFGVPLYYDDGSLMHGGMYFDIDTSISVDQGKIVSRDFVRVEHYGKGSPPGLHRFTRPRPVPSVTGAFMSIDRPWFERLGGFAEDYVFGHYEDADLCLRSLEAGVPVWLHDIRLYHLEGRGSVRRSMHEGGSVVNRWLFSRHWAARIAEDLRGPDVMLPGVMPADTVGHFSGATGSEALGAGAARDAAAADNETAFERGSAGEGALP